MELLLFLFSALLLLLPPTAQADTSQLPGTIERTTKQQLLAAIPPGDGSPSPPFLVSPAGKYRAYFLRSQSSPGAGGFGNDFCFIRIEDSGTGETAWESDCVPVSTSNVCSLVFSDDGIEVFDGSNSAWSTDAQSAGGDPLQSLELVDEGDMRVRDKAGELAWKASDEPRGEQRCGQPGSPGLAPTLPPFAQPIGGDSDGPFGMSGGSGFVGPNNGAGGEQRQVGATFGFGSRPLVDDTPYDSGSLGILVDRIGLGRAVVIGAVGFGGFMF